MKFFIPFQAKWLQSLGGIQSHQGSLFTLELFFSLDFPFIFIYTFHFQMKQYQPGLYVVHHSALPLHLSIACPFQPSEGTISSTEIPTPLVNSMRVPGKFDPYLFSMFHAWSQPTPTDLPFMSIFVHVRNVLSHVNLFHTSAILGISKASLFKC